MSVHTVTRPPVTVEGLGGLWCRGEDERGSYVFPFPQSFGLLLLDGVRPIPDTGSREGVEDRRFPDSFHTPIGPRTLFVHRRRTRTGAPPGGDVTWFRVNRRTFHYGFLSPGSFSLFVYVASHQHNFIFV